MKKKWLAGCGALGCVGMMFVLCGVLPFAPYAWRVIEADQARQRWDLQAISDYTLTISKACFCPDSGEYKITVQNGSVVAVETAMAYMGSGYVPQPQDFNGFTIDAMLATAASSARTSWDVPWFATLELSYDPTYGYVTQYATDLNGTISGWLGGQVFDAQFYYSARDLQVGSPSP